jgi:hypothetical protein
MILSTSSISLATIANGLAKGLARALDACVDGVCKVENAGNGCVRAVREFTAIIESAVLNPSASEPIDPQKPKNVILAGSVKIRSQSLNK